MITCILRACSISNASRTHTTHVAFPLGFAGRVLILAFISLLLILSPVPSLYMNYVVSKAMGDSTQPLALDSTSSHSTSVIPSADDVRSIELTVLDNSVEHMTISMDATKVTLPGGATTYRDGDGARVEFTVTSGTLDFFILDSSEYLLWTTGHDVYPSIQKRSTSGDTVEFQAWRKGTFYLVFDNRGSATSKQVSGDIIIDRTPPTVECNLEPNANYSGAVTIRATATDALMGVNYIQLFIDGALADTENGASLSYRWETNVTEFERHIITIVAMDRGGNSQTLTLRIGINPSGFFESFFSVFDPSSILVLSFMGVVVICLLCYRRRYGLGSSSEKSHSLEQY